MACVLPSHLTTTASGNRRARSDGLDVEPAQPADRRELAAGQDAAAGRFENRRFIVDLLVLLDLRSLHHAERFRIQHGGLDRRLPDLEAGDLGLG